jgi:hypothetical protein
MIPNETRKTKVLVAATISREVDAHLNKEAAETGNKSHIIEKALRLYFGLNNPRTEPEKIAS